MKFAQAALLALSFAFISCSHMGHKKCGGESCEVKKSCCCSKENKKCDGEKCKLKKGEEKKEEKKS